MSQLFRNAVVLVARVMLSLIFIAAGANHIVGWGRSIDYMMAKGMLLESSLGAAAPAVLHAMLAAAVVLLLLGGLSVLLGLWARWGAVLLIAFLVPTTLIFHNFWAFAPGDQQYQIEMINFMKNLGLAGGLLLIWAFGSGGFSVDTFLPRSPER